MPCLGVKDLFRPLPGQAYHLPTADAGVLPDTAAISPRGERPGGRGRQPATCTHSTVAFLKAYHDLFSHTMKHGTETTGGAQ